MTKQRYKRSLSNVKLTRKYHYSYMGFWVLVCVCLLAALNLVLFLYIDEHWGGLYSLDAMYHEEYMILRHAIIAALWMEMALFTLAIIALAKVTAHRIAGPLIRLEATMDAVAAGNLDQRLKFRDYDHLEQIEAAFNRMMEKIRERVGHKTGTDSR